MKLPCEAPKEREFDVAGFGTNAVDHLIRVTEFPAFGSKVEFESHLIEPGGEVATTIVGLQRLGHRTAYAGRLGDDDEGLIGLNSLKTEGIDCAFAETVRDARTQTAFILIDKASGERTIAWRRDPLLAYDATDAPTDLAARCGILHLTPHDTAAAINMAKAAKESGAIVSADVDRHFDGLEELLPLVDICIFSDQLPRELGDDLAAISSRFGCAVVGMTLGVKGSLVYGEGNEIATDALDVPGGCIDTTGAGDAFRTGFLHGVLTEESLEKCCQMANATAALNCRKPGARAGLPTPNELQTLLKKYGHP